MEQLDRLLNYLEENIDLEHVDFVEKLHCSALDYQEVPYLPISVLFPVDEAWKLFPCSEAFEDPEKMLFNELLWSFSSIYNSVKLKDHFPMHIRSNHGVGILASLFGANCRIVNENMPWVDHFEHTEEVKKIIDHGVPDFHQGLGARVMETYKYFLDRLREYPKCYQGIHISQPDLQGPFDIAHLLIGTEIFYQVHDEPELIHKLLEVITQTYIGFRKHIEPLLTDQAGEGRVYVHGSIYGGKVVIKDDTAAINLSEEMYNEFSKRYNEKILGEFKGGTIHHCGQERPWHFKSILGPHLRGINYGNPEMHELKNAYDIWKINNVPIIWWGYNQNKEFLDTIYTSGIKTGVTVATKAENLEKARRILSEHVHRV